MSLNIYVLDVSPTVAAQMLDDVRLVDAAANALVVLNDAWLLRRRAQGDKSAVYGQIKHPRHPITRHAAQSVVYCEWVAAYGQAAMREVAWRNLRIAWEPDATAERIARLPPGGYVALTSAEVADFPQRLDGGGDAALVAGDPVTAYRRWYVDSKVPGGALAWEGAEVVWTRREPSWLTARQCQVSVLPYSGIGPVPIHMQWVACLTTAPSNAPSQRASACERRPDSPCTRDLPST